MRLPKGVVKGVKDDFTLEKAERKIKQQELEIESLKRQLARLRFNNLPKEEVEGISRVFRVLGSSFLNTLFGSLQEDMFIMDYLKQRDEDKQREYLEMEGELPF